jgi:hypothetical protein
MGSARNTLQLSSSCGSPCETPRRLLYRLGLLQDVDVGVSLRQPHSAQEIGEARVGAYVVVNGVCLDEY